MDYQNYLDWTEVSGIYLRQYSQGDRYRTFKKVVSPAGLNTLIVAEFLRDNPNKSLNVSYWRTHAVYEVSGDKRERINLTSTALAAIGANLTAEAVKHAKSQSPFEGLLQAGGDPQAMQMLLQNANPWDMLTHLRESLLQMTPGLAQPAETRAAPTPDATPKTETWQQVADLLEAYVADHQQQLEADIAQHGDPRILPGYSRKKRLKELDREREQLIRRESLVEEIPQIRNLMNDLRKKVGDAQTATPQLHNKLKSSRRKLLEKLKDFRKEAAEAPLPEATDLLHEVDAFIQAHPVIFTKLALGPPKLEQRLTALGDYSHNEESGEVRLSWEKPNGFDVEWCHFELTLTYPQGGGEAAIAALLNVAERTKKQIQPLSVEWKRQLVESFREHGSTHDDWEQDDADLEFDDSGELSEQRILNLAGAGHLQFACHSKTGGDVAASLHFDVDWDQEHGLTLEWDEEPDAPSNAPSSSATTFSPGGVQLLAPGPPLTAADLNRLEHEFSIRLPAEYRSFLLESNGGVPTPNHLALTIHGDVLPYDVEYFFSLSAAENAQQVPAGRNLKDILAAKWRGKTPKILLPIARLKSYSHYRASSEDYLYFALTGKKSAQVLLFDGDPLAELAGFRNFDEATQARAFQEYVNTARVVGKTLTALFKKLQHAPQVESPAWLRMIQEDDRAGFLAWLDAGGSLKQKHQGYGQFAPSSMVDLLTRDASPALLQDLLDRKLLKPQQIQESWKARYRYDVARFRRLMPLLPKDAWPCVLCSPSVWDQRDLLEELAALGVDFNEAVDEEGAAPIHLAVRDGNKAAVQWLMDHGADPHKNDDYQRNAFTWAENGPGFDCLPVLKRLGERQESTALPTEDCPGLKALSEAAAQLPPVCGLVISVQIKSPPVTRIEQSYYKVCHYTLVFEVGQKQVTYKDVLTPRQNYLYAGDWPESLFAPILQWPELTLLWDTLTVEEVDRSKAFRKRNYQPISRPELLEAARAALEQGFNQAEANNRGVRLRKS